jgi:hypothetical protein
LRQIEDPNEVGVINPTKRAFTGVVVPEAERSISNDVCITIFYFISLCLDVEIQTRTF